MLLRSFLARLSRLGVAVTVFALVVILTPSAFATVTYSTVDQALSTADYSTSFDGSSLVADDLITNEFAADGFTFSGGLRFASCPNWPNTAGGWTPAGYGTNLGPGCTRNTTDDSFAIHLSATASAASLTTHSDILDGAAIRIDILLDGAVVDSFDITESNESWCCAPRFVLIDGLVFNQINVTELSPVSQSWLSIDNLAFNEATVVSAPAGSAILTLGFLGLIRRPRRCQGR